MTTEDSTLKEIGKLKNQIKVLQFQNNDWEDRFLKIQNELKETKELEFKCSKCQKSITLESMKEYSDAGKIRCGDCFAKQTKEIQNKIENHEEVNNEILFETHLEQKQECQHSNQTANISSTILTCDKCGKTIATRYNEFRAWQNAN